MTPAEQRWMVTWELRGRPGFLTLEQLLTAPEELWTTNCPKGHYLMFGSPEDPEVGKYYLRWDNVTGLLHDPWSWAWRGDERLPWHWSHRDYCATKTLKESQDAIRAHRRQWEGKA